MGIIEQIMQMKSQGIPDEQIVYNLKQGGVSPKEINDAINQAKIKNAVMSGDDQYYPSQNYSDENPPQQEYPPQQQGQYYPESPYGTQQEQYPIQQSYGIDADSVMEISEKVFDEKIKKIQKQVSEIAEFKTISQTKIEGISERLKKVEAMIDQLQIKILEKVSSYGENLESIKNEMGMMQDSFQKMINPILDKTQEKFRQAKPRESVESSLNSENGVNSSVDEILRKSVTKKK
jgi:hypothetical protein